MTGEWEKKCAVLNNGVCRDDETHGLRPSHEKVDRRKSYAGHTARQRGLKDRTRLVIDYNRPNEIIFGSLYVTHYTDLDLVYKEAVGKYHCTYNTGPYYRPPTGISIDQKNLWELLINTLKEKCIRSYTTRNKWSCSNRDLFVVHYELPIVHEEFTKIDKLLANRELTSSNKRYFTYNSVTYDKEMLYSIFKGWFVPYGFEGDVNIPKGYTLYHGRLKAFGGNPSEYYIRSGMDSVGTWYYTSYRIRNFRSRYERILNQYEGIYSERSNSSIVRLPNYTGGLKHVTIDFGENKSVRYMTLSGRPLYRESFRVVTDNEKTMYPDFPSNGVIKFVRETEHRYVTKFRLAARQHGTKTWISLGEFTGVSDRLAKILVDLSTDITARYFMVTPITWNGAPDMDIEFYGKNVNDVFNITSKDYIKTAATPKTITYSIELPSNHLYKAKTWAYKDRKGPRGQTLADSRSEMTRVVKSIKKGISVDKIHDFAQSRRGYEGQCVISVSLYYLELDSTERLTVDINGDAKCIITHLNKKLGKGMYSAYYDGYAVNSVTLIENLLGDDIIVVAS
jgi:hypothetical protein